MSVTAPDDLAEDLPDREVLTTSRRRQVVLLSTRRHTG
jgi:hypothetical protein